MILSGRKIKEEIEKGNIIIDPYDSKRINPNSYNLSLGDEIMFYTSMVLDPRVENPHVCCKIPPHGFVIHPGQVYLCKTAEKANSDLYVPVLDGRSSIGRLGLFIHVTAGYGDVGFKGVWTLELVATQPIIIIPGMEICQVRFHTVYGECDLYKGKYNNNGQIKSSQIHTEFDSKE